MEKRIFERIPSSLAVRFPHENMFYSGTVLNLSEKGMFISTKRLFPAYSVFSITIKRENELLKVFVRVKRAMKTNGYYDGIGVEILNPQKKYLEFVENLRLLYKILKYPHIQYVGINK